MNLNSLPEFAAIKTANLLKSSINTILHRVGVFLLLALFAQGLSQGVYERGTFVSIPAGKHVNHSYYGLWNVYFAVEDGVLVYNHHEGRWLDPITASDGLNQYPVLLVWQNTATQDIWMVTPDYVFLYDPASQWMSRASLPTDPKFSGKYDLGFSDTQVIVSSTSEDDPEKFYALFQKSSGGFEAWGTDTDLDVEWNHVKWIETVASNFSDVYESLPVQNVYNGGFNAEGLLHMDGHPLNSTSSVSALSGDPNSGEAFLSTYGLGVFTRRIPGAHFTALPFGLLSPDVMSMALVADQVVVGGRAGLTFLEDFNFSYDEAITEVVFDYSFITSIDASPSEIVIAGRGGVFKSDLNRNSWERIISKKDLLSKRIYSVAAGNDGNIMVGTERNAYLFHESGLFMQTIFPDGLDWPVFDITHESGVYYISSYHGLYLFDEESLVFSGRINTLGEVQVSDLAGAVDPIYECEIVGDTLWASTHRGLLEVNLQSQSGRAHLAPQAPFRPRGLCIVGNGTWVGSDIGLYSFNSKSSSWRHYTESDGLVSNFVTDIIANRDYIWLGTNLGLTRIKWRNLY